MKFYNATIEQNGTVEEYAFTDENPEGVIKQIWERFGVSVYIAAIWEVEEDEFG